MSMKMQRRHDQTRRMKASYEAMRKALIAVNNALGHKMNSELGDMVDSALALAEGKEPS